MTVLLLCKAGAGSRGGHVIATTKSGHPVYESHHARYASLHVHQSGSIAKDAEHVDGSFAHYGKGDHEHAASAHFKEAYRADYGKKQATPEGKRHLRAALAHNRLANTVKKSGVRLTLVKSGAGSRGGVVLGTTRSGKPIYASGHHTDNYHGVDHTDAAEAHNAHGFLAHIHRDTATSQHHQRLANRHLDSARGEGRAKKKPAAPRRPLHEVLHQVFARHAYAKSDDAFEIAFASYVAHAHPTLFTKGT